MVILRSQWLCVLKSGAFYLKLGYILRATSSKSTVFVISLFVSLESMLSSREIMRLTLQYQQNSSRPIRKMPKVVAMIAKAITKVCMRYSLFGLDSMLFVGVAKAKNVGGG